MGKIREKFLKKKLLIVGGVLGLGLFAFWIYTKANQTPVVTTVAAVRQDISQTLNTSGTVVADKVVNCFAPVSARIGEIQVQKGGTVKKGEGRLAYDETARKE